MKEYSKTKNLTPARMNLEDLKEITSLIKDSIPGVKITLSLESNGISLSESDPNKFTEHKDIPSILGNIRFWASDGGASKTITIKFSTVNNYLSVSGQDETWVMGTFSKVYNLLKNKCANTVLFNSIFAGIFPGIFIAIVFFNSISLIVDYRLHGFRNFDYTHFSYITFSIILLYLYFSNFRSKIIIRKTKDSWIKNNWKFTFTVLIGLLNVATPLYINSLQSKSNKPTSSINNNSEETQKILTKSIFELVSEVRNASTTLDKQKIIQDYRGYFVESSGVITDIGLDFENGIMATIKNSTSTPQTLNTDLITCYFDSTNTEKIKNYTVPKLVNFSGKIPDSVNLSNLYLNNCEIITK